MKIMKILALALAVLLMALALAESDMDELDIDLEIDGAGQESAEGIDGEIMAAEDGTGLGLAMGDLVSEAPEVPATVAYRFIVNGEEYAAQAAVEGEEIVRPADPEAAEGMAFAGWILEDGAALFTDADGDGETDPVIAHVDPQRPEVIVTAKFVEKEEPADEQQQPADEQQQPADEQQQPTDEQQQPADDQQQPADDQQQPADDQQQPADDTEGETTSSVSPSGETASPEGEASGDDDGGVDAATADSETDTQQQPADDEQPADDQQQPADEQQQPADEQQQPADEQQQPADEQQQPSAEQPAETTPVPNELTYTGEAQALVSAEGAWLYSLDGENYSADLPAAVDAGEYMVFFKAAEDAEAQSLTVTVAKADVVFTPPTAATGEE